MERVLVQDLYRMVSPVGGRVMGSTRWNASWQAFLIDGHNNGERSTYGRAPVSSRC
jgi:hypothetical protein